MLREWNCVSTPQRLNPSTPQPLNPSTPQPLNASTPQPLNPSTPQPLNPSTPQPLNPSTPQPLSKLAKITRIHSSPLRKYIPKYFYYLLDQIRKSRAFKYRYYHPHYKFFDLKTSRIDLYSRLSSDEPSGDMQLKYFEKLEQNLCSLLAKSKSDATGQWSEISTNYHLIEFLPYIAQGKVREIDRILRNPFTHDLMYGFDNMAKSLQNNMRIETSSEVALTADHFMSLADYLGVVRFSNPEEMRSIRRHQVPILPVIDDIVRCLFDDEFKFPNPYEGERGIFTNYGTASLRVPHALYQALKLKELGSCIAEIGPGLGRTAYFAQLLGANTYTLVDLTLPCLYQTHFLFSSHLETSKSINDFEVNTSKVSWLSPTEFKESDLRFDVVGNFDSLTEMGEEVAMNYLEAITRNSKYFYSINHEGNAFTIRDLASRFPCMQLLQSQRSWIRPGYIEETYIIN